MAYLKSFGSKILCDLVSYGLPQELQLKDPMRSLLELQLQPGKFQLLAKVLLRPNQKQLSLIELRLTLELRLALSYGSL